jgi:hypothetical protein
VTALAWAALDVARSPGELALCLVAFAAAVIAIGWLWRKANDGSRKDG